MLDIKTVLCPTDFSPVADRGVDLATQICEHFHSKLVLQYNLDTLPPFYLPSVEILPDSQLQFDLEQEKAGDQLIRNLIANLPHSFEATGVITRGQTHSAILNLSRKLPADLIVMGTHGRSGLGHMLIGSNTERVVSQAQCPVLTARSVGSNKFLPEPADQAAMQILVPLDFSPHSLYTLNYSIAMAETLPVALNLFHVVELASWEEIRQTRHLNLPEFSRSRMHSAELRLRALVPARLEGRVHTHVVMGPVAEEITRYAEKIQARLIIMGLRPKGVIDEILFGATSYGVLRASRCPVWIVPGMEQEAREEPRVSGRATASRASRGQGSGIRGQTSDP